MKNTIFQWTMGCLGVVFSLMADAAEQIALLGDYGPFWGGDVRCQAEHCLLVAVAHEKGRAVILKNQERKWTVVGEISTAYHPDGAAWLDDTRVAVAVEGSQTLELAEVVEEAIKPLGSLPVGFSPRDVRVLPNGSAREVDLLASPYSGNALAHFPAVKSGEWGEPRKWEVCATPWHPSVQATKDGVRVAVGCLDDKRVQLWEKQGTNGWKHLAEWQMPQVPRHAVFSRDGQRLYVALELGGKVAVIDVKQSDRPVRWIPLPSWGAVSVAEMADGTIAWGEDRRVFLQRCDWQAGQCVTKALPATGFPDNLRVADLDQDGHEDLIVFNGSGKGIDLWYGPLFEAAEPIGEPVTILEGREGGRE